MVTPRFSSGPWTRTSVLDWRRKVVIWTNGIGVGVVTTNGYGSGLLPWATKNHQFLGVTMNEWQRCRFWYVSCVFFYWYAKTLPEVVHPWKINGWNIIPWRFGSDDVPFFSWVIYRFQPFIFQGVCLKPFIFHGIVDTDGSGHVTNQVAEDWIGFIYWVEWWTMIRSGGFKYFFNISSTISGRMGRWTHFDEHIFQRGWFNHQLVKKSSYY